MNLDRTWSGALPDGFGGPDTGFDVFLNAQGAGLHARSHRQRDERDHHRGNGFAPAKYMKRLRAWCDEHQVTLISTKSGRICRTGTWGFEHYGVVPDLICCGKGSQQDAPFGGH